LLTVNGVDKDIFLSSNSISMVPCISAEWNQNIFNSPYVTVAGDGTKKTITKTGGPTLTEETESNKHPNFNTFSYDMDGSDTISYTCTGLSGKAYKIITYITTDSLSPILVNTYAAGGSRQFGSNNVEVISAGWTKVETVIGGTNDTISSFTFNITPNKLSSADSYGHLYLTQPEVYETTYFDYQRGAIWNTEAVFTGFRPGESYVTSGNSLINFPSEYRKINTSNLLKGNNNFYMPVSPLFSSPSFFMTSTSAPVYKHSLFSSLSNYKYFISDTNSSTSISGIYADTVLTNKVVIKFNTYLSIPTVNVSLTLSDNSVINSGSVTPDNTGTLILYLNSGTLNTTKWSTMPTIDSNGAITNYIDVKKITVQLVGTPTPSTYFNTSNSYVSSDKNRMHVVEISPRLELDLTDYVISVSSNKSLDGKETYMPISSVVTDDASIVFSGIPLGDINSPIPVFSNVSNYSNTKLKGLLRKNVKFYINYLLKDYVSYSTNANISVNKIIPGGVWYSDIWQQQDINTIDIQCFDITRYLQTTPSSDYVSTYRDAFEVIANVLDLAGFTDYDIDSLYSVCKDNNTPINMNYYFCNSKDTTLMEALNQIFLPYQIAAYIDNYGVMKFLSLSSIMQKTNTSEDFILGDDDVVQGGYSITNKTKPGKISLRYTTPRIKQSLSLQNVSNIDIKNGPGYVYTTSNDVVWEQQTTDAVGLNFLSSSMNNTQNYFNLNASDLLDIFHTFDLNNNGYVAVEDEIMSFAYKEYTISNTNSSATVTVSVKNHLELAEAVNRFIQENKIGLVQNYGAITNVTHSTSGGLGYNTYTISSSGHLTSVNKGDYISVSGMNPDQLNVSAQVVSTSGHTFTVRSDINKPFVSGGEVTKGFDYDVVIAPTGKITNVQRGMFGTNVSAHNVISTLTSKNLSSGIVNSGFSNTSTGFSVDSSNKSITINPYSTGRNVVYPTSNVDESYNTFSVKFNFDTSANLASAGLFMGLNTSNPNGATFLELVRYNVSTNSIPNFKYILVLSQEGYAPTAYADVTSVAQGIVNNFQKLYYKNNSASKADGSDAYILYTHPAETFHLRFTAIPYTNSVDGEGSSAYPSGYVMGVFLNNFEITNWQQYIDNQWTTTDLNTLTGLRKKVRLNWSTSPGLKFGAVADSAPIIIYPTDPDITYPTSNYSSGSSFVYIREIYATQKVLKERSVNYYFQDREFLNGMIQGERLFSDYKEYIMQTQPTAIGINTYDVQYTNGAAVSVDVLPAEYSLLYFPGNTLLEQQFIQHQLVDEYSVSYSTPLNTGFRAKFALANNSPHMVYLKKDSDELVQSVVNFNLWTHEIIVPSDPEIVEHITDAGNLLETMQIDTPFIQSKSSALKLLKLVEHSLDNFSKDVSITIFGNPIIEVGDIVKFTYPLAGINQQKYLVHSVQNSFNEGFTTKLILNQLNKGINI
jgi:hypothetical protein